MSIPFIPFSSIKLPGFIDSILGRTSNAYQVVSTEWKDRQKIVQEQVNLFCWDRQLPIAVDDYLEEKLSQDTPKLSVFIDQKHLVDQLAEARAEWGNAGSWGEQLFWGDVTKLAADFLHFSKQGSARLYLRTLDNDACTKFHVDGYHLRLFTTYLGPGTEWLPEYAVNRSGLGKSNDLIVKDDSAVQRMKAGQVAILKGEVPNEKNTTKGIVHRSPPVAGSGEKRVVLRIDL